MWKERPRLLESTAKIIRKSTAQLLRQHPAVARKMPAALETNKAITGAVPPRPAPEPSFSAFTANSSYKFMAVASKWHRIRAILYPGRADALSTIAYFPGRASVTAFRNADAPFIALPCACWADAFSVDTCLAVNAAPTGNLRYALATAVSSAARAFTPAVAAHLAVRTIRAGDCLIGTVASAFRFSCRK
jgi:hypothetical protein